MKNYYEILEVSKNASQEVIEKAYRTLAKKYHPDRWTINKKFAENKFKEITDAYNVLSNNDLRKSYDAQIDYNYNNLYEENKQLKSQIDHLKSNQANNSYQNNSSPNNYFISKEDIPRFGDILKTIIKNQKNKTKEEHITSLKALALTFIIIFIIIILFVKVPFLNNLVTKFP